MLVKRSQVPVNGFYVVENIPDKPVAKKLSKDKSRIFYHNGLESFVAEGLSDYSPLVRRITAKEAKELMK